MEQNPINQIDSDSTPKPAPKKTRKRKVAVVGENSSTTPSIPKEELAQPLVENLLPTETEAEIEKEVATKIPLQPTVKPALSKLEQAQMYFQDLAKRIESNRTKRYDEELWDYLEKNRRTLSEECALIEAGKSPLCKRLRNYALTKYEKLK